MPVVRLYWDLNLERLRSEFRLAADTGFQVQSIAAYGPHDDQRFAVLWYKIPGRRQVLRADLSPFELIDYVQGQPDGPDLWPALVTGNGVTASKARWTLVLEEWSSPPGGRLPSLTWSMPWRDFSEAMHGLPPGMYVRSADLVGLRETKDAASLSFCGTVWPCDDAQPWNRTTVRSENVSSRDVAWQNSQAAMVMSSQAALRFVTSAPGRNDQKRRILTLWDDRMFHPWPENDPFQRRKDFVTDQLTLTNAELWLARRQDDGMIPLSIGASGANFDEARFHVVWVPKSQWLPLDRKFVRDGPGDGATAVHHDELFVRNRLAASMASAWPAGMVHEVYREHEIRPGVTWLEPRFPAGGPGTSVRRGLQPTSDQEHQMQGGLDYFEPPVWTSSWHPLDVIMRDVVMQRGARGAQLCVLVDGRLVFARAYTYAEQGYPIITLHHRARIGSISKAITATLLVPRVRAQPGGLTRTLAQELDVSPVLGDLEIATVAQAMRHATGLDAEHPWLAGNIVVQYANGAATDADIDEDAKPLLHREGTMRFWYENLDVESTAPFEPGEAFSYNNYVFACLGEALSRRTRGVFDSVRVEVGTLLNQLGASIPQQSVNGGQTYGECEDRDEIPYHSRTKKAERNPFLDVDGFEFAASPYVQPLRAFGAAGGWAVSAVELARFMSALTIGPGIDAAIISGDDLRELTETLPPPFQNSGLAWVVQARKVGAPDGSFKDWTVMWHNGGLPGTSTLATHLFDPDDPSRTFSLVLLLNQDDEIIQYDTPKSEALHAAALGILSQGGWATGDLFDEV